jgi:predicted amidophosphoribosyltransferase
MWCERRCAGCGEHGVEVCDACLARLVPAGEVEPPAGLDRCWCLFEYESVGRALVAALKFHNRRALAALLGAGMAGAVASGVRFDVVTWAPTSSDRRASRGYDQSRLLATAVATDLGCPCRRLLRRRRGPPQTGADRAQRAVGPGFTARVRGQPSVLLVDDVVTTGATVRAAANALRVAGAVQVVAVAAARTGRHG